MTNSSPINPTISLAEIRKHKPCFDGWKAGVKAFGKNGLEEKISLGDIALNQGAADALWCLRVFDFSGEFKVLVLNKVIHPALSRAQIIVDVADATDADAAAADAADVVVDTADADTADAYDKERELQRRDIIANFPPVFLA
jgi:hypothetical protein